MEPPERLALAVGEEHHLHSAYSTVWFLEKVSSTCEQCGQWPICARWCFAVPALDWEDSGRGKESWLFPGTISHWIAHLLFQSSFMLHHFPLRERTWAREEMAQCALGVIALILEREPVVTSRGEDQTHCCWPLQALHLKVPQMENFSEKQTFLTALAVHMCVVGRVALLQDDHI